MVVILKRLLIGVLLVEALAVALYSGNTLRYPDERDYVAQAGRITTHGYVDEQLQPTAYRPPAYPWMLTVIRRASAQPLAAKVFNILCLLITAWLTSRMAEKLVPRGGVVTLGLTCAYPLFVYTAGTLYPQTCAALLLALIITLLIRTPLTRNAAAQAGLMMGLLALMVPAFLMTLPLFAGWLLRPSAAAGRRMSTALLFLLATSAVVAPWTLRNYRVFHQFIPVSSNNGLNLLLGNSPGARPNSGVNADVSAYTRVAAGMPEAERDRYYRRQALAWVQAHPGAAIRLYLRKVLNYFNFRNELFVRAESSTLRDAVQFLVYYPLLLAALARLLMRKRFPMTSAEGLLYLLYFGNALLSAVFFTRLRFRVPFDFLLAAMAGTFIARWLDKGCGSPAPSIAKRLN